MTWSSLIVYVDDEADNIQRIEQAAALAKAHGAHLIGVSACAPETPVADAYGAGILLGEVLIEQHERAEKALKGAEARFREIATRAGVSCEWRADVGDPTSLLIKHARSADVLIVGRDAANASGWRAPHPADLAMRAGRSILIVPPNPARSVVGAPVLLAWTDSRESRLAAVAAIPMLREAESVRVLELCDPEDMDGARLRTADVVAWLTRHGVKAEAEARAHDDRSTGRRLLDCAAEMKAGAIVSGAWGHARMRQWIFGGVTQTLITESPVALLLAH
ncbi:universal stress protein [Brevundimonas sp. P7753]|uniref:universal stress protein n=1 Tax=Brevundimonas sp. P7753 TaxID=2726982 RepID=UPI0015C0FEB6|nr:universal stress protein [Brevundimonas sp. P7753]NWE52871.1 universal stress protein [Brevundimonas sp. P7753]